MCKLKECSISIFLPVFLVRRDLNNKMMTSRLILKLFSNILKVISELLWSPQCWDLSWVKMCFSFSHCLQNIFWTNLARYQKACLYLCINFWVLLAHLAARPLRDNFLSALLYIGFINIDPDMKCITGTTEVKKLWWEKR